MSNTSPPLRFIFFRYEMWPGSAGGELYCVGYHPPLWSDTVSITVFPIGSKSRELCKEVVRGKHAVGKTFEIVTVPHRLEESVVLGAKYFLLTRERP
jgi:hypothetical protein